MTQEQFNEAVDEIAQEQQQLDDQQGVGDQSPQLTEDRVRQMLEDQLQTFSKQVSGLQSGWDRGLNAIRGDMEKKLEQRITDLHTRAGGFPEQH
jgi:bacterioferritin-associated ferredoxin